jgi:hypothetical protein
MSKYSEAGKGSKPRPTDQDAYSKGWDLIFNKNSFGNSEVKKTEEKQSEKNQSK